MMRDLFPEYNKPTTKEFSKLWENALFVFDSNVLLSLYRLPQKTRKKLLGIIDKLKDRIWIPHHVAKEYYRGRRDVIMQQDKRFDDINTALDAFENKAKSQLEEYIRHPFVNVKPLLNKTSKLLKDFKFKISKSKDKYPDLLKDDIVEKELNAASSKYAKAISIFHY